MLKLIKIGPLLSLLWLGWMPRAMAMAPNASQIVSLTGDRLMVQQGNQRQQSAQVGHRLENFSQSLIVPGNNHSLARLVLVGDRQTYDGLLLQAGPAPQQTTYRFPCVVEGGTITLSWQQGQQRGCADGLQIRPTAIPLSPKTFAYLLLLGPGSTAVTENQGGIILQPSSTTPICVRVTTKGDRQTVEVLWGEVILRSTQDPKGIKIRKGTQYTQGELAFFSPELRLSSPAMETFFTAASWSGTEQSSPFLLGAQAHIDFIREAFAQAAP
ncbi:hypothetical protein FLX56_20955 [Synechococcus moorigangaii CMS01]|nr:hypothetical protein [Synechococcus moorigangaii CMS01]